MPVKIANLALLATVCALAGLSCPREVERTRAAMPSTSEATPSCAPAREDFGDLIVLHTCGSYEEMGRQQARLLGPVADDLFEFQLAQYHGGITKAAFPSRLALLAFDRIGLPLVSLFSRDPDGTEAEQDGIANELRVSRLDVRRFRLGALFGGSTVVVATRGATLDGNALIGRNIDWPDAYGRRRPVLVQYRPTNGDLMFVTAGWPLLGMVVAGMNEAGLSVSYNFFNADDLIRLAGGEDPLRRALRTARTTPEAVRIILDSRRFIAGFFAVSDSNGGIAQVECALDDCAVKDGHFDWFAQTNHAVLAPMLDRDRGREPDTITRLEAVETAVSAQVGSLSPERAAGILRDRSTSSYVNGPVVASAFVLNSLVMQPHRRILWHSTSSQPVATFGTMMAFSPGAAVPSVEPLPADPRFAEREFQEARQTVSDLRQAVQLSESGRWREASDVFDQLATQQPPMLDPRRLAWARARASWGLERQSEAEKNLQLLDRDGVSLELRTWALVVLGWFADERGERDSALALYQKALVLLNEHTEFNHRFSFGVLRDHLDAGLRKPRRHPSVTDTPHLQHVPG